VAILAHPDERFSQRSGLPRLLITGGSQGARSLNSIVPEAIALLPSSMKPRIHHQAGAGNSPETRSAYEAHGIDAEVHEFIENMSAEYAWADLVICRAGALTISELAAAGLGAILIPYPFAVDDHQTRNAGFLADAEAALLVPESGLTPGLLAGRLETLLADRQGLLAMARAARSVAVSDAAEQVVDHCEKWVLS
jgi:UDP-N-acetylglucosamine--N-acetylmuramyl-(pentapeptide) pyrophosphoryl-undecaprenol N-acetylglucosamine transferase